MNFTVNESTHEVTCSQYEGIKKPDAIRVRLAVF